MRYRYEYVVILLETQRTLKLYINSQKNNVNDIVLVYDKKVPRHFWRIAVVTGVLPSRDSEKRWVVVRIGKTNTTLKRPVNKLFTVGNTYHDTDATEKVTKVKTTSSRNWWTKKKTIIHAWILRVWWVFEYYRYSIF